ncbi:MAG: DNA polymerase IV [Candidatus Moranbacteria bacterium]|nr:DNA polymerase IV [Candidatus Moranbacteria bacterium]
MSALLARGAFPRAILHIDGDAFFASCEQSRDPALRGRPVITGAERGIASSMSYEAKAKGITRAMRLHEIRRLCPDAVILPSDYETYSLLSKRFFDIVRRYTPDVEEYGIDECFADITGWNRPLGIGYAKMAERIQEDLRRELGFTFSIGLASTKVLAKTGSKWQKPFGLTAIENRRIPDYLAELPVGNVWGIGPRTTDILVRLGIRTALDLARSDDARLDPFLSKPFREIRSELRGHSALPFESGTRKTHYSVQKMKTFTPASNDPRFVFAQLAKNIESACMRARQYGLEAGKVLILLRTQTFEHHASEIDLSRPTNFAHELLDAAKPVFDGLFRPGMLYRATMITLLDLRTPNPQPDLFGESLKVDGFRRIYEGIDAVRAKYGKHTIHFGPSFDALHSPQHKSSRGESPARARHLLRGESARKRLNIPMFLGEVE